MVVLLGGAATVLAACLFAVFGMTYALDKIGDEDTNGTCFVLQDMVIEEEQGDFIEQCSTEYGP